MLIVDILFVSLYLRIIVAMTVIEDDLNVNDILRTDLMPNYFIEDDETNNLDLATKSKHITPSVNGSIDAALLTLDFHR